MEGGGGREGKIARFSFHVISAFGHAIITKKNLNRPLNNVLYCTFRYTDGLLFGTIIYPVPSMIRYCVGLAKEAYYIVQQQPQCGVC